MEHLLIVLLGSAAGVLAGMLSGIGAFATMLFLYPFLINLEIVEILLFYASLITATQYIGSVAAIYLGIPGEATSMPAVVEGKRLYRHKFSHHAITNTAIGSFIGGILAVAFTVLILPHILKMFEFTFRNDFRLALFTLVIITITLSSNKNVAVSLLQLAIGSSIGLIGWNPYTGEPRMTFGILDLEFGIPEVSMVFATFVLPIILKTSIEKSDIDKIKFKKSSSFLKSIKIYSRSLGSSLRGTVFGYFLGLVPSVGTILASNFSYAVEKKISRNALQRITSAEAANNSGIFTMMLPLLIIGIPIVGSEIIVYELLMQKGMEFGINHNPEELIMQIVPWIVLVNFLMLFLSWPLSKYLTVIYKIPSLYIKIFCSIISVYTVFYVGFSQGTEALHILSFVLLLPLGYFFRNYNTLPMIVGFLLAESFEGIVIRQLAIFGKELF